MCGGDTITISGEDARHIARSLRMRVGEALTVCDGEGTDYDGVIEELDGESVTVRVERSHPSKGEPRAQVTVYQGYPKGDKLEFIIEKAVELGACEIVPVMTERSVARPDGAQAAKKAVRWQRHALEAAKQCGRGVVPRVAPLTDFAKLQPLLERHELVIFCYEEGGMSLRDIFADCAKMPSSVGIFIGAEGGIAQREAQHLADCGAVAATLGTRILRCETAPIAALTAVMLLSGDMD